MIVVVALVVWAQKWFGLALALHESKEKSERKDWKKVWTN